MFSENLKRLRMRSSITQAELAKAFKISQSTVGMWECGRNRPEYCMLLKLAEYFCVPVGELTGEPAVVKPRGVQIPVLSNVPAGSSVESAESIIDYEEIDAALAQTGEFFGFRVNGSSMEPKISDGDIVIVRKQDEAYTGDIIIVMVNGSEAMIKRLKKGMGGIILYPSNPEYDPMYFTSKQIAELPVRILGKVVELRAKFE